ncbi:MAG: bifunctional diaminohydroxyphosphoribosylaminopyrimidine deaminase/5-amino-6-(5-phosphoribosylamino)uracil reductase RibD [Bdellovibrionia bacterium]
MTPAEAMRLAIEEGRKGLTTVSPNPAVGAVILESNGALLSKGFHHKAGEPHAEIEALKNISPNHTFPLIGTPGEAFAQKLKGAQMFVTLEPCAHHGRTPPCAEALAKLPFASVTYGLVDPNPKVSGQGAAIMNRAGVKAELFSGLRRELEELAEIFLHNMRSQMPFVAVKVATSLDGKIGRKDKPFPQWLTGPEARLHVHYLRACYDAILVGRKTVEVDDPGLNIRHPDHSKENKVIVLDSNKQLLPTITNRNIFKTHKPENIFLVFRGRDFKSSIDPDSGVTLVSCPDLDEGDGLELEFLLKYLYQENKIASIFVEGGVHTFGPFFKHNLVQRLYHFRAPVLIGDDVGWDWKENFQPDLRLDFENSEAYQIGEDQLITGRINKA